MLFGLFVFLIIITFPITNPKFNAQFYNLTKNDGYDSIKIINIEKQNTVLKAKASFREKINELEALEPSRSLIEIVRNYTAGTESEKKQDYLIAYRKFYESPYWDYWQECETLSKQYNEKKKTYDEINKEYSKYRYVTYQTEKMLDEMNKINREIDLINDRLNQNYELADNEYTLFTKHLSNLYEKYY